MDWDMIGHQWAVRLMQGHLASDRVRHAYLITGPRGIGRRTLALRYAQALNCTQPPAPGFFCGTCRDCRQLGEMAYPDLAIVELEEDAIKIKVDQIRTLQRSLSLAPYQARYRVALLLHFEQANENAQNALLKTLEEPAPQVVLILTAESAELLLPTIVSRCEVLRLQPVPAPDLAASLTERWSIPAEQANLLAQVSRGRPGFAYQLSQDKHALALRSQRLDEMWALLQSSHTDRFIYMQRLSEDKEALQDTLLVWISYWHDVMRQAAGSTGTPANLDREQEIEILANRINISTAATTVRALERTLGFLDNNINNRLAAEVLMLDLPRL